VSIFFNKLLQQAFEMGNFHLSFSRGHSIESSAFNRHPFFISNVCFVAVGCQRVSAPYIKKFSDC
jgi:hypothetical protein